MRNLIQKTFLLTVVLAFFSASNTYAQQKLTERKLENTTWKMVFKVKKEINKEADEADTYFEEMILRTVSGVVGGALDKLDIYFNFKKNNQLIITVKALKESETEKATWEIKDGKLHIESLEDKGISINGNDDWVLMDGILIQEDEMDDKTVYMTQID